MGWLIPTEAGLKLIPQVTTCDASTAIIALGKFYKEQREKGVMQEDVRNTTEFADLAAAQIHEEAFGLELRRSNGAVIPTEWIAIQDTHRLIAFGQESAKELEQSGEEIDPEIEEMAASLFEEWKAEHAADRWKAHAEIEESEMPRYQVMVELLNEFDVL